MPDSKPPEKGPKLRVLVIEDEVLIAVFIEQLLGDLDCEMVGPVLDLRSAIEAVETTAFDVALLNLVIGGVHAYHVAELLAQRDIPFAFASGVPVVSIDDAWRDRPFLNKPFLASDIRNFLAQAVPAWRGPIKESSSDEQFGSVIQANPRAVKNPSPTGELPA